MFKTVQNKLRLLKYYILDIIGLKKNHHHYALDYSPILGKRSKKAERLVDYCLGDNKKGPILPCTKNQFYLSNRKVLLLQTDIDKQGYPLEVRYQVRKQVVIMTKRRL